MCQEVGGVVKCSSLSCGALHKCVRYIPLRKWTGRWYLERQSKETLLKTPVYVYFNSSRSTSQLVRTPRWADNTVSSKFSILTVWSKVSSLRLLRMSCLTNENARYGFIVWAQKTNDIDWPHHFKHCSKSDVTQHNLHALCLFMGMMANNNRLVCRHWLSSLHFPRKCLGYRQYFVHVPLSKPKLHLMTYMKKPTPVLGCLTLIVTYSTTTTTHKQILTLTSALPAVGQTTVNSIDVPGIAAGFVHRVKVYSDVPPVQQRLCRLPFAVCRAAPEELKQLEADCIIERVDLTAWVSTDFAAVTAEQLSQACNACPVLQATLLWPCTIHRPTPWCNIPFCLCFQAWYHCKRTFLIAAFLNNGPERPCHIPLVRWKSVKCYSIHLTSTPAIKPDPLQQVMLPCHLHLSMLLKNWEREKNVMCRCSVKEFLFIEKVIF